MQRVKAEYIREDKRGRLIQVSTGIWRQVNYIFIRAGERFGEHYHKHKEELFFIIRGICEVSITNTKTKREFKSTFRDGECFLIKPFENHTLFAFQDTEMIELLSSPFSKKDTII